MALFHTNVTVGTSATVIASIPSGATDTQVWVWNNDLQNIYIGDSAITVTSGSNQGFPVVKNTAQSVWLKSGDTLYGISAAGTSAGAVISMYSTIVVKNSDSSR
jgi:hypothetical protein